MRLLLDTHIWLWSMLEPDRLSAPVTAELRSPEVELWLSPISVWETLLLAEKGRIELDPYPQRWIEQTLAAVPMREAALTRHVAVVSRTVDLPHQDPADRFLAATAVVHDLTLVTADAVLAACPSVAVLANR